MKSAVNVVVVVVATAKAHQVKLHEAANANRRSVSHHRHQLSIPIYLSTYQHFYSTLQ